MATGEDLDTDGSPACRAIAQADLFTQENTKPARLGRPLLRQRAKTLWRRLLPERADVAHLQSYDIALGMMPGMGAEIIAAVGIDNPTRMARGQGHRKFPFVISVLRLFLLLLGYLSQEGVSKRTSDLVLV